MGEVREDLLGKIVFSLAGKYRPTKRQKYDFKYYSIIIVPKVKKEPMEAAK